jgi:non-catalytic primase subunit PriX-like protein
LEGSGYSKRAWIHYTVGCYIWSINSRKSISISYDTVTQGSGVNDFRKITIDLVLAPYLINVKKCDYDIAYDTISKWLDKCAKKRSLTFNVRYKVNHALNHAKDECMYPMKLDTIRSKYREMYQGIFVSQYQPTTYCS